MSYFMTHLHSGWHVDQSILVEEDRVVVIRFGHDHDSDCMAMDETLYGVSEKVQNFAVIYLGMSPSFIPSLLPIYFMYTTSTERPIECGAEIIVDITEVPDFNKMYELYDPCTVMFFYR
ncbi:thioredoxin-like protein 4A [Tremella mesenterica]|uniref:Thioredoxin-like protein 4A n=1 Tax=Tremella mesenterica TaxID=5217 RepID=A0A4Q1BTV5_TREME|nr:thioredoxin-like protein 4A [Tremella mesenterica]